MGDIIADDVDYVIIALEDLTGLRAQHSRGIRRVQFEVVLMHDLIVHAMLRKAAYGPGNWFQPKDVMHLRRAFGFPGEFRDVELVSEATQYRAACQENRWEGGLRVRLRSARLRRTVASSTQVARRGAWTSWLDQAILHQVVANLDSVNSRGKCTPEGVESALAAEAPRPWDRQVTSKVRRSFQRSVTQRLSTVAGAADR